MKQKIILNIRDSNMMYVNYYKKNRFNSVKAGMNVITKL